MKNDNDNDNDKTPPPTVPTWTLGIGCFIFVPGGILQVLLYSGIFSPPEIFLPFEPFSLFDAFKIRSSSGMYPLYKVMAITGGYMMGAGGIGIGIGIHHPRFATFVTYVFWVAFLWWFLHSQL